MQNDIIKIREINDNKNGEVRCKILINQTPEEIIMTFSSNVSRYITIDRCDAIVMGLLMFAIRQKLDIHSDLPISETLYYKLTYHYIPGICTDQVFRPQISATVIPDIENQSKIVATGISCGVDSLYTIMEHTKYVTESLKLNHLVFLDAGAHHFGSKDKWNILYEGRRKNAIDFSKESNLNLIEIKTNLPEILEKYSDYNHIEHHTFMMLSCILMIQRGIKKYYYSGGYPYEEFYCKLLTDSVLDCAYFDLFTLWTASHDNCEFYTTGGSLNRFDKVKALKGYILGEKYLNVCVTSVQNCGTCFKCKRTLLELDAAGSLDKYGDIFDINTYKRKRLDRIKEGYRGALKGDNMLAEMMTFFKSELSPMTRRLQKARVICGKIASRFK